jgi:hypothetical protein
VSDQAAPVLRVPSPRELRAELEQIVVRDLLGPAGGPTDELDERSVRDRYLVGMLAPRGQLLQLEQSDELATAGAGTAEEGLPDPDSLQGQGMSPFSLGITFSVAGEATALKVTCRWGSYQRIASETLTTDKTGGPKQVWRRTPVEGTLEEMPLAEGPIEEWTPDENYPDVRVRGRVRRVQGHWIVTLFLVNNQKEPRLLADRAWLFQPELTVEAPDGAPIFRRRLRHGDAGPTGVKLAGDAAVQGEQDALAMMYRHHVEFAVGHGVSVHVDSAPGQPDRAIRVRMQVIPTYEVPQTTPPTSADVLELADVVLDMKVLAELAPGDIPARLAALPDAYARWIRKQRDRIDDPAEGLEDYRDVAEAAMDTCERALARIRAGLGRLARDPQAAEAFPFMNRAMWLQRTRSLFAEQRRRGEKADLAAIDVPGNRSWRPSSWHSS